MLVFTLYNITVNNSELHSPKSASWYIYSYMGQTNKMQNFLINLFKLIYPVHVSNKLWVNNEIIKIFIFLLFTYTEYIVPKCSDTDLSQIILNLKYLYLPGIQLCSDVTIFIGWKFVEFSETRTFSNCFHLKVMMTRSFENLVTTDPATRRYVPRGFNLGITSARTSLPVL